MGSVRLGTFSFSPEAVAAMGYEGFKEKFGNAVPVAKYGVRRAFELITKNVKVDETKNPKKEGKKGGQGVKRGKKENPAHE